MKSKLGFVLFAMLLVVIAVGIARAATVTEPTTFRDVVKFRGSTGPDFDSVNSFSIGQVKVTVTADQLNAAGNGASTGNVALASITNALVGTTLSTNTITGDGKTNVIIWAAVGVTKVMKSITTTP